MGGLYVRDTTNFFQYLPIFHTSVWTFYQSLPLCMKRSYCSFSLANLPFPSVVTVSFAMYLNVPGWCIHEAAHKDYSLKQIALQIFVWFSPRLQVSSTLQCKEIRMLVNRLRQEIFEQRYTLFLDIWLLSTPFLLFCEFGYVSNNLAVTRRNFLHMCRILMLRITINV